MKVILEPKFYGYCPGLKRSLRIALELAEKAEKEEKKVYFDVPLAHNENVERMLEKKGFTEAGLSEATDGENNYFLISAHGASHHKISWLREHNYDVQSATCPTVRRVQDQAIRDQKDGFQVVIFGKKDHAEVEGVNGCIEDKAIVVKSVEEAKDIKLEHKTSVICQTTFPGDEFKAFVDTLKKNNPKVKIVTRNTICPIVESRINQTVSFVKKHKELEMAVVVGSVTSSNTKQLASKLADVIPTAMIGDEREIDEEKFADVSAVLVVSGTSAPPEVVEQVARKLREIQ